MCLAVYLAAPSPLPLIPFQEDAPAFNVAELADNEQVVRAKFSLAYVVYAGSHSGCGCGFQVGHDSSWGTEPDDPGANLASLSRLVTYLRQHAVQQLYVCWMGDEGEPVESERRISVEALLSPEFALKEREMLHLLDAAHG